MNPLVKIVEEFMYEPWDHTTEDAMKQCVLRAGIPGIVDIKFTHDGDHVTVTPVFATEEDWVWYNLKYANTL